MAGVVVVAVVVATMVTHRFRCVRARVGRVDQVEQNRLATELFDRSCVIINGTGRHRMCFKSVFEIRTVSEAAALDGAERTEFESF